MSDDDDLGIYFKCFRGANAHFALSEPASFALRDAFGRDWLCYPVPPHVVRELDMHSELVDVKRADQKVGEKTVMRLIICHDISDLAAGPISRAAQLGASLFCEAQRNRLQSAQFREIVNMSLAKLMFVACLVMAAGISGGLTVANLASAIAADAPAEERSPSWVDQRIVDWELSQAERRFDEIGWAGGLGEAERLARESKRPLFVFTYSGSATEANAIALRRC